MSDVYISPTGSGDKSGSSWANAAAITSLDAMIKMAGAGGTVLLAADKGNYNVSSILNITTGGVTIKGMNTNDTEADAHFVGTRPANWVAGLGDGNELFRIQKGADNLTFKNMTIDNTATAFRVGGDVKNLTIDNVDAHNVQRLFEDYVTGANTTATISGLTIKNVDVVGFSKDAIRLQYDTNNVTIQDVKGDSGRQDGDNFAMGIHLEDTVHNVTMQRVTMENATDDQGTGHFWNGDGFTAEKDTYNLTFIDTVSSGNTDAGYDIKASHVTMTGVVAEGNGRNFRFWGKDITVNNATGLNPDLRGGASSQTQVWVADSGQVKINNSTFTDSGAKTTVFNVETGGALTLSGNHISYAGSLLLGRSLTNVATQDVTRVAVTGLNSLGTTYAAGANVLPFTALTTTTVTSGSITATTTTGSTTTTTSAGDFTKIVSTTANETFVGTTKSEMFLFDQSHATGADTIKSFGPNDFAVFTKQLGDADGDGKSSAGSDGIFQLSNGGTLIIQALTGDLRLLGHTADGYVYGDSKVWAAGSTLPTVQQSVVYTSTAANETYIGSNAHETFVFDTSHGTLGKDVIRGFGPTDVVATKVALFDGNSDGLIAPGKNGLDLGDKLSVVSMPELGSAGLRFLGHDTDGYIYADARVRPTGAVEGKVNANDTLAGDKGDLVTNKFFFDTALDRQLGADKITGFGAKDVVLTTSLLGTDVVGSHVQATNGAFGLHDGSTTLGSFAVQNLTGATVGELEFDGHKVVNGVDYFVYSAVGSTVGVTVLP